MATRSSIYEYIKQAAGGQYYDLNEDFSILKQCGVYGKKDGESDGLIWYGAAGNYQRCPDSACLRHLVELLKAMSSGQYDEADQIFLRLDSRAIELESYTREYLIAHVNELSYQALLLGALRWAMLSDSLECVKLAIIILGLVSPADNAKVQDVLYTLGKCSEFTHFVLPFCGRCPEPNREVFHFAKAAHGWGRLAALQALNADSQEVGDWVFREGVEQRTALARVGLMVWKKSAAEKRLSAEMDYACLRCFANIFRAMAGENAEVGLADLDKGEACLLTFLQRALYFCHAPKWDVEFYSRPKDMLQLADLESIETIMKWSQKRVAQDLLDDRHGRWQEVADACKVILQTDHCHQVLAEAMKQGRGWMLARSLGMPFREALWGQFSLEKEAPAWQYMDCLLEDEKYVEPVLRYFRDHCCVLDWGRGPGDLVYPPKGAIQLLQLEELLRGLAHWPMAGLQEVCALLWCPYALLREEALKTLESWVALKGQPLHWWAPSLYLKVMQLGLMEVSPELQKAEAALLGINTETRNFIGAFREAPRWVKDLPDYGIMLMHLQLRSLVCYESDFSAYFKVSGITIDSFRIPSGCCIVLDDMLDLMRNLEKKRPPLRDLFMYWFIPLEHLQAFTPNKWFREQAYDVKRFAGFVASRGVDYGLAPMEELQLDPNKLFCAVWSDLLTLIGELGEQEAPDSVERLTAFCQEAVLMFKSLSDDKDMPLLERSFSPGMKLRYIAHFQAESAISEASEDELKLLREFCNELAQSRQALALRIKGYSLCKGNRLYAQNCAEARYHLVKLWNLTRDPQCALTIAELYRSGLGCSGNPDPFTAHHYYLQVAVQGVPEALYHLSGLYQEGKGCPKNLEASLYLARQLYNNALEELGQGKANPLALAAWRLACACWECAFEGGARLLDVYKYLLQAEWAVLSPRFVMVSDLDRMLPSQIRKSLSCCYRTLPRGYRKKWLISQSIWGMQQLLSDGYRVKIFAKPVGRGHCFISLHRASMEGEGHIAPVLMTFPEVGFCRLTASLCCTAMDAQISLPNLGQGSTLIDYCAFSRKRQCWLFFREGEQLGWLKAGEFRFYGQSQPKQYGRRLHFVGVKFSRYSHIYDYICRDRTVKVGSQVTVMTQHGEAVVDVVRVKDEYVKRLPLPFERYKEIVALVENSPRDRRKELERRFYRVSLRGILAYMILCCENAALNMLPQANWRVLSERLWQCTQSEWGAWADYIQELCPYDIDDYLEMAQDDQKHESGISLNIEELNALSKLYGWLDTAVEGSGQLEALETIIGLIGEMAGLGEKSSRAARREAYGFLLRLEEVMRDQHFPLPDWKRLIFFSAQEEKGWGQPFDGRHLSPVLRSSLPCPVEPQQIFWNTSTLR